MTTFCKMSEEDKSQAKALTREFLDLIKKLPEESFTALQLASLPSQLGIIGSVMYGEDKELLEAVKADSEMARKLWMFIVEGSDKVLRDVVDRKRMMASKPRSESLEMLEKKKGDVRTAFAAITNFIQASIPNFPPERYAEVVPKLRDIWYRGQLDEFEEVPYFPLKNLTVDKARAQHLVESESLSLAKLVERLRKYPYHSLQFRAILATVVNLSQLRSVITDLINCQIDDVTYLEHLMPSIKLENPSETRTSMAGIFKNIVMFPDSHSTLLDKDKDLLSYALEPIVGQGEYSEEEMSNMPIPIYGVLLSGEKKERDPVNGVRLQTLEFLYQLCSTKSSRESLRDQSVYYILREYHKWETDEALLDLTEQVVNILIQTEDEIGVDCLKSLKLADPQE